MLTAVVAAVVVGTAVALWAANRSDDRGTDDSQIIAAPTSEPATDSTTVTPTAPPTEVATGAGEPATEATGGPVDEPTGRSATEAGRTGDGGAAAQTASCTDAEGDPTPDVEPQPQAQPGLDLVGIRMERAADELTITWTGAGPIPETAPQASDGVESTYVWWVDAVFGDEIVTFSIDLTGPRWQPLLYNPVADPPFIELDREPIVEGADLTVVYPIADVALPDTFSWGGGVEFGDEVVVQDHCPDQTEQELWPGTFPQG